MVGEEGHLKTGVPKSVDTKFCIPVFFLPLVSVQWFSFWPDMGKHFNASHSFQIAESGWTG